MSNDYDNGAGESVGASGRPLTREPYRGPRIRNRRTGEERYWIGDRYVSATDPARLTTQDRESVSSAQADASRMSSTLPDLNRFEELNRNVPTGSITHRFGMFAGNMPRVVGIDNPATPQNEPQGYDEMRSIVSRLTPSQRVEGSGSSSNLDVGMFREGLPNVGNSGPANSRIISGYRRQARVAQAHAEFMDWYWPRTGSLQGADAQFNRYRTAVARDPELTWQDFFGASQPPAAPAAQGQGAPQPAQAGAPERWERNQRTGRMERQR